MSGASLLQLGKESIAALEDERGILASQRGEAYGCVFGRDSLIVGLELLRVYEWTKDPYYTCIVGKILRSLCELQGREFVLESGEEPGKIIHEYRPHGHEHLTAHPTEPWYLYPDQVMRNYDSVDATPLFLMLVHAYCRAVRDDAFVEAHLPHIEAALSWLFVRGDSDRGFVDYRFHAGRTRGGLRAQSWMDSAESLFFEESADTPRYPIAPVEVQAYAWAALHAAGALFARRDRPRAREAAARAAALHARFNETFVIPEKNGISLAFALDGDGRLLRSPRSSMGHVLWAAFENDAGQKECILAAHNVKGVAKRVLWPDLFVPRAGVRTLSSRSRAFDAVSYHNGSIWPHDTAMLAEGLENFGFAPQAREVRRALLRAYSHFKTPIELFCYSRGTFREYTTSQGGKACRVQAWSAASLLSTLHAYGAVV